MHHSTCKHSETIETLRPRSKGFRIWAGWQKCCHLLKARWCSVEDILLTSQPQLHSPSTPRMSTASWEDQHANSRIFKICVTVLYIRGEGFQSIERWTLKSSTISRPPTISVSKPIWQSCDCHIWQSQSGNDGVGSASTAWARTLERDCQPQWVTASPKPLSMEWNLVPLIGGR